MAVSITRLAASGSEMWEPTYFYPFTYEASGGEGRGASPLEEACSCSAVGSQRLDGGQEFPSGLVVVFDPAGLPSEYSRGWLLHKLGVSCYLSL